MRAPASSQRRRSSVRPGPALPACSPASPLALGRRLERGEGLVPERVEVVAELAHAVGIDPVEPPRAVSTLRDEPGLLQDAQVLRDRGPADRQLVGDLADRAGARAELLEDRP